MSSIGLVACLGATEREDVPERTIRALPSIAALASEVPDCGAVDVGVVPPAVFETPGGWASVEGDGLVGTTGGAGGSVVLARTLAELIEHGGSPAPLVILVCGVLGTRTETVEITSNKTVVGVGTRPTIAATIEVDRAANVVIRDVFVQGSVAVNGSEPDGISIRRSHHVWIDHVDISDGADGNLDITNETSFVTVSWSRFWYRDPVRAHRFSSLIGSSDTQVADAGRLKVTLHHNWWGDNVVERMPRARFGDIHVFNNYYSSVNNNYCIRSGVNARLLVERNFFHKVKDPMVLDGTGEVMARDNAFESVVGRRASVGEAFEPPYAYETDLEADIADLVPAWAGPRG